MQELMIVLDGGKDCFQPGERVTGTVTWYLSSQPKRGVEVRLVWWTSGIGTQDEGCEAVMEIPCEASEGSQSFSLQAPEGPYSFSGSLITLQWAVEAVAGRSVQQLPIVVAPDGVEVKI
jgi:hypothetical protein